MNLTLLPRAAVLVAFSVLLPFSAPRLTQPASASWSTSSLREVGGGVRAEGSGSWNQDTVTWATGSARLWGTLHFLGSTPNAARFRQIGLEGDRSAFTAGRGVKVAVIDTGVDFGHPALHGALDQTHSRDFVDGHADARDESGGAFSGHGTAVAGIVHQVAPGATLLPLRVLGPDGQGSSARVADAIVYAVAQRADIINLSLGSHQRKEAVVAAVKYAAEHGVIVVCAVGNQNQDHADYPAALAGQQPLLISVGSVDARGVKSSFSNYGDTEVSANGERVETLYPGGTTNASGTSFAAPQVAGLAALALAHGKTPAEVARALVAGAARLDDRPENAAYAEARRPGKRVSTVLRRRALERRAVNGRKG